MALRRAGLRPGAGASSISFWFRRWTEQSRSPRWMVCPWRSARICTSTCRGFSTSFSRYISSFPKQAAASALASAQAAGSSSGPSQRRMPLPPPPAEAFSSTGQPTASAAARASSTEETGPSEPGVTGTPAAFIKSRAADLEPAFRMASPEGPMKVSPALAQASEKSAFSERKP